MKMFHPVVLIFAGSLLMTSHIAEATPNQVLGTWRMQTATIDPEGRASPAYGARPNSLLVFTPDMHFIEVLTDADVPKFASAVRGDGTAEENRAAMAGSIGFFGSHTVGANGVFSGNRVEGATFPNWIGSVRTRQDLRLDVEGDHMKESFQRPDGTRISIAWQRVR